MKRTFDSAVLLLGILSFPALGCLFLALADIYQEYVSTRVLAAHSIDHTALPDVYHCTFEWIVVIASFCVLLSFLIVFAMNQIRKYKAEKKT